MFWRQHKISKKVWKTKKKLFPETFCAMGSWEAPGFSSQVAMQTLYYSGRDQVDQETPLVSGATSALGIYAPPQPICVILFIIDVFYLSPTRSWSKRFYKKNIQWKLLKISLEIKVIVMGQSVEEHHTGKELRISCSSVSSILTKNFYLFWNYDDKK